jgi:hypothetical protein
MICLTTLVSNSDYTALDSWMTVYNGLERIWKEVAPWHLPRQSKTTKILSLHTQCLSQSSDPMHPKYKSEAAPCCMVSSCLTL